VAGSEYISNNQQLNEYIMLALRSSGLNLSELREKFGNDWIKDKYDYFIELKNQNLLKINENAICLTKKGYAVCDEILGKLL
jgi:oxygen-independent coproporphyrinogen-3 oxidase